MGGGRLSLGIIGSDGKARFFGAAFNLLSVVCSTHRMSEHHFQTLYKPQIQDYILDKWENSIPCISLHFET